MTFGTKLKKLRIDNQLTQDELAEKIYVTRTAISKWETDRGYPSLDSLKLLADLFQTNLDNLISNADIENKKLLEAKHAKRFYWLAVGLLTLTVVASIVTYLTKIKYLWIISFIGVIGYVGCAFLSKPKYKRIEAKKYIWTYVLSRIIILLFVLGLMVYTMVTM